MESLTAHTFTDFTALLNEGLGAWIDGLPAAPDEALPAAWHTARQLEKLGWRFRVAVAGEIHSRAQADKQRGARIMGALEALAEDLEVSPRTIEDDARIARTFPQAIRSETETWQIHAGRQALLLASRAPDPQAALESYVARKAENAAYTTRDFAHEIKRQKAGAGVSERIDIRVWELQLEVADMDAFKIAVNTLIARWGCDWHEAVARAVGEAAETQEIIALPIMNYKRD